MDTEDYNRRVLASLFHMNATATWDDIHKHAGRIQARIDRADAKSREWAARHPEKVAESNKRAQAKRRAKAKGGA